MLILTIFTQTSTIYIRNIRRNEVVCDLSDVLNVRASLKIEEKMDDLDKCYVLESPLLKLMPLNTGKAEHVIQLLLY